MTSVWPNTQFTGGNWNSSIDGFLQQHYDSGSPPEAPAPGQARPAPAVVIGQSPPPGPVSYGPPVGQAGAVVEFPPSGLSLPAMNAPIAEVRWGSDLPEPIEIDPGLQNYLEDRYAQSSYHSVHDAMQANGGPWAQADAAWARMGHSFSTPGYDLFLENFLINHFSPDMDPEFAESWLGSVVQRLNTDLNLARAALPAGTPASKVDLAAINASLNPKGMALERVYMPDKAFQSTPGPDTTRITIPSKLVLTYPGAPKPSAAQYDVAGFTDDAIRTFVTEARVDKFDQAVEVASDIIKNAAVGRQGEAFAREQLEAQGWEILGEQVRVLIRRDDGVYSVRIYDFVARDPQKGIQFIEVKTNGGELTQRQLMLDAMMRRQGGVIGTSKMTDQGFPRNSVFGPPVTVSGIHVTIPR